MGAVNSCLPCPRGSLWNRRVSILAHVAAYFVLALIATGSFGFAVGWWDHNENMYVSAAVLLLKGKRLYTDFAYFQAPYLPYLYAAVLSATSPGHYLLLLRITTWILWLIACGLLFQSARAITLDVRMSLAAAAFFAENRFTLRILVESSNYVLPLTLHLAAVYFLLVALDRHRPANGWLLFSAGVAAGLSVGSKLYYAAMIPPLLVGASTLRWTHAPTHRLRRHLLLIAGGFALALIPAGISAYRNISAAVFDNVGFHHMMSAEATLTGLPRTSFNQKVHWLADQAIRTPSNLLLIALLLLSAILLFERDPRRQPRATPNSLPVRTPAGPSCILALATVAGSLVCGSAVVLYMTPLFPQYVALLIPYALLLLCILYRLSTPAARHHLLVATVVSVLLCLHGSGILGALSTAIHMTHWVPVCLARDAQVIRASLEPGGTAGPIATLEPIFALEAGLPIYDELATGVFGYQVAHNLSSSDRRRLHLLSRYALDEAFRARPPAAILLTNYPESLQGPLRRYATDNGYHLLPLVDALDLYVQGAPVGRALAAATPERPVDRCRKDRE